ncbi:MAG: hypothetical protein AAGF95_02790 [Chloroflexota bacterium]
MQKHYLLRTVDSWDGSRDAGYSGNGDVTITGDIGNVQWDGFLRGWAATLALPGPGVAPWESAKQLGNRSTLSGGCLWDAMFDCTVCIPVFRSVAPLSHRLRQAQATNTTRGMAIKINNQRFKRWSERRASFAGGLAVLRPQTKLIGATTSFLCVQSNRT